MKKILVIAGVVLVVLIAAIVWIKQMVGVTDAARLVPPGTVVFASFPDLLRTAQRWPKTAIAQIGAEPEVKAFLEKPLDFLLKKHGAEEGVTILNDLKPGRIFVAVTSFSQQTQGVLVGFQFWGSSASCQNSFARLRQEIQRGQPVQEPQKSSYNGVEILTTTHGGITLLSASVGNWGFLANNTATINDAIDRARSGGKGKSLADDALFKKVLAKLPAEPDSLGFCQPQPFIDALLAIGSAMQAQQIPEQVEQLRKTEALGYAMKLDGSDISEAMFILRQDPLEQNTLTHKAIKLTTADTTAYFDSVMDLTKLAGAGANPSLAPLAQLPALQNSRILQLAPEAFGPECAISVAWPPGQMKPEAIAALQVKDQAKASEGMQELMALFPETILTARDGINYYSFPSLQSPFSNPTIALAEGFLLVGLDITEVDRAIAAKKDQATLESSPSFASAKSLYNSANLVFGYVDSKIIFTRAYDTLKPVMTFGISLVPGMDQILDSTKIPATETIARHLQPILYAQTHEQDGYLVESRGPITMNQAVVLTAGAAAYFLRPAQPGQ